MADRRLTVQIVGDASSLSRAFGKAGRDTDSFGSKVGHVAGTALKGLGIAAGVVGVAVAVGMKKSLDAAGDFQESLNVLKTTTNGTNAQLKQASKLAIKLGQDIKLPAVSAGDAADAMLELGRDGFTMKKSMVAARATLLLVTAAQTNTALAAKTVTQNINAFGLKAKDTNRIVDQMAGFMNATGTSFDAFTDSLSYVAAPAHTVGQSFKETAAQLAILSQKGIEGSMAGTGLRQVLVRLGSDGSKAGLLFKSMGVDVINANGNFIGIRATIEKMAPVLAKMTRAQRLAFFKDAFGQTAMNQANILFTTTIANYDKVTAQIARKGQADALAASHMKGYNGAMAQLSSAVETLQIEIGLKLLPVATRFMLWLVSVMPIVEKFAGLMVDNMLIAVQWVEDNWPTISATITQAFEDAKTAWEKNGKPTLDAIVTVTTALVDFIQTNWQDISGAVHTAMTLISTYLRLPMDVIKGDWGRAWEDIKNIPGQAWEAIVAATKLEIDVLKATAGKLGEAALNGLKEGIKGIVEWFGGKIDDVKDAITTRADNIYNAASNFAGKILPGLKDGVGSIGEWMGERIGAVVDAITNAAKSMLTAATGLGGKLVSGFETGLSGFGDVLARLIKAPINAIIDGWNGLEFSMPSIDTHIPGVGKVGGTTIGTPNVPRLASGGIVSSPTLALIGEAGPEAVVPLSSGSGGYGMGGITVINYISGSVTSEGDLTENIRRRLAKIGQRNGGSALGAFA